MTFEQWLSTLPKHRQENVEASDWIKVYLRDAWIASKRSEKERIKDIIRHYKPDEGLTPLNVGEQMTLELVTRKIDEE